MTMVCSRQSRRGPCSGPHERRRAGAANRLSRIESSEGTSAASSEQGQGAPHLHRYLPGAHAPHPEPSGAEPQARLCTRAAYPARAVSTQMWYIRAPSAPDIT